jgi:hypothetical protein
MRLIQYGEPGYQSGDDWGAGGYNPHMNGDPESEADESQGTRHDAQAAAPSYGPDPDEPWTGGGGYNPHYQPSASFAVPVAIRRT